MAVRADVQHIIDTVSAWEGVTANPHRFGGVEFNLGKVEVGHIHNHGMVDIPFTRSIRDRLIRDHEAGPHHLLHDSGWITFYLRAEKDTEQALRLYRLSYLIKRSRRDKAFAERGHAELAEMGYAPASAEHPDEPEGEGA